MRAAAHLILGSLFGCTSLGSVEKNYSDSNLFKNCADVNFQLVDQLAQQHIAMGSVGLWLRAETQLKGVWWLYLLTLLQ